MTFFGGYDLYIIAIISPLEPEKNWDFMDSCSSFMLLLTFYGGYDLYIIAIISPLELEKNFGTSWIHILIFVTIDFFGGYDLYLIATISPLEPERAAEARSAVVASTIYNILKSLAGR